MLALLRNCRGKCITKREKKTDKTTFNMESIDIRSVAMDVKPVFKKKITKIYVKIVSRVKCQ